MAVKQCDIARTIILAGVRTEHDPLLKAASVAHKGLLNIGGQTIIARVAAALTEAGLGDHIVVTADLALQGAFQRAINKDAVVEFQEPGKSPVATFQKMIDLYAGERGLLVTTCDHALLSAEMINSFLDGIQSENDAAAAIVEESVFRAEFPEARRTFIKLKDGAFSGANLFWVNPARADPLFSFWRSLEINRKNPLKMAGAIGVVTALQYLTGSLDRTGLVARIKRKTGVNGQLVALPFANAAIDVDNLADLELVRALI